MTPRRLYLDNAATSFPKPASVADAVMHFAQNIGASAGRGGYREAMDAGQIVADCRHNLCKLFNGQAVENVVFTLNCTDALNMAINGLIDPKKPGHAIHTQIDHNSIVRPIAALCDDGLLERTRLPIDPTTGLIDLDDLRNAIRPDTRFVALSHASNVTGTVQRLREISQITRAAGVPLIVDAAQSIGHLPIDVQRDGIDFLACPGHKALLGPLGTGFLYIRPGMEKILRPLRRGGTGSQSEQPTQPESMPDKFESGSHNVLGIAGLNAGVQWVLQRGVEKIFEHDRNLIGTFIEGLADLPTLKYFGPRGVRDRIGVFSIRIDGLDPQELSTILESQYGLLTRAGLHCAPGAHEAIGTLQDGGTTRLSFGPFLTPQDVSYAADALADVALKFAPATR